LPLEISARNASQPALLLSTAAIASLTQDPDDVTLLQASLSGMVSDKPKETQRRFHV
jgi:hypothetical protein